MPRRAGGGKGLPARRSPPRPRAGCKPSLAAPPCRADSRGSGLIGQRGLAMKKLLLGALVALSGLTGAASAQTGASGQTFNLQCAGKQTVLRVGKFEMPPASTPFATVYRVDLGSQRWCSDACSTTNPINSISATSITFQNESDEELGMDLVAVVNRESGDYGWRSRFGLRGSEPTAILRQGTCTRADFTGFPALKF